MDRISTYFKNRKLRFDILTIFLALLIISFVSTIWFTYNRNYNSILEFSKGTIERAGSIIVEKLDCLLGDVRQTMVISSSHLELQKNEKLDEDTHLISFLIELLKVYPDIASLYVGMPSGNFLEIVSVAQAPGHYKQNTNFPLMDGTVFAYRYIDTEAGTETWYYINGKDELIGTKCNPEIRYNPTTRPWYEGAINTSEVFWTAPYESFMTGQHDISVSKRLTDQNGNLLGVVGGDINIPYLSDFIAKQKIGKSGKAFVFSKTGEKIMPLEDSKSVDTAKAAYALFVKNKQTAFTFEENGVEYLSYVQIFPITTEREWHVVMIAPLEDFFAGFLRTEAQVTYVALGILIIAGLFVWYFAKRISKPIVTLAEEVDKIRHFDFDSQVVVKSNIREINLLSSSILAMRAALKSFGKYVPKEIVQQLVEKGEEITLGGTKKEITIMFTDITDFTIISDTYPIDVVMPLLAEYFDLLSKTLIQNGGTIDKYVGDGILAIWGAPKEISDHAVKACIAALECQKRIGEFNRRCREAGKPEFITRIGINTGHAIVGNIGTIERMNYTVIGDAVNIAARLHPLNKEYKTSIIISQDVVDNIGDQFIVRQLDEVLIRGKKDKLKIYELVGLRETK